MLVGCNNKLSYYLNIPSAKLNGFKWQYNAINDDKDILQPAWWPLISSTP